MKDYHVPVMLNESISALKIQNEGIYVDATLGGGGHTKAILDSNKNIKVFAFDQDEDAIYEARNYLKDYSKRLTIIKDNFANLRTRLALERIKKIDGILFDLGVSSHQISKPERGFSFSLDGKLDMRMDKSQKLSAYDIINNFSYEELKIFSLNLAKNVNLPKLLKR